MARPGIPSPPNIGIKLRVHRPTVRASSCASAEDIPLSMTTKQVKESRRSLSPVSNRAPRKGSYQSEPIGEIRYDDLVRDDVAWDIIDREISDWQKVCRTGRPSWWPPISKWTQRGSRSTWREGDRAISPWHMSVDYGRRSEQFNDQQRRAATDSHLADNNNVQDLAYAIAVQLLGACFTLPPQHISSYATSAYHRFNACSSSEMPDSRLISSLRMHAEARYLPSIGHQARNTSPAYLWQGAYDGPSPSRSRRSSSDQQALSSETTTTASRRRVRRALHLTEGSAADCTMDNHLELNDRNDILPTATTSAWHRLKTEMNIDNKSESNLSGRNTKSCPSTPSDLDVQLLHSSHLATEVFRGRTPDALPASGYLRIPEPRNSRTLQSITRSEPHRMYLQPVKELVVKRWHTFRRRFGYDVGSIHHELASKRADAISSLSTSSLSTPAEGSLGSSVPSSNEQERRRQARESGDVHSNNVYSNPRYNTPIPVAESGIANLEYLKHPSPYITSTKGLGVAQAVANAFADSGLTTAASQCFTSPNSLTSSAVPSLSAATSGSPNSKVDSCHFISPATSNSKPLNSPPTSSARRHGQRRHQRSNLSEIYTPEEVEERSVLSGLANPLLSPKEETGAEAAGELPSQAPKLEIEDEARITSQIPTAIVESCTKQDEKPRLGLQSSKVRRPSIVRTSTSGTQVFTPSADGIELNGLPTGETLDEQGLGNGRKERSFL